MRRPFRSGRAPILRRFTAADVQNLCDLDSDPEVMRFITGGKPTPQTVIEFDVLPRILRYYEQAPGLGFFAAIEKATGRFLGWFEFRPLGEPGTVEFGYRLHRAAWGRGYATEGARALIRKGFTDLGVQCVMGTTMTVNTASRRVMEKAGLTFTRTFHVDWPESIPGGEQGDVEYRLTRETWAAAAASD